MQKKIVVNHKINFDIRLRNLEAYTRKNSVYLPFDASKNKTSAEEISKIFEKCWIIKQIKESELVAYHHVPSGKSLPA